MFEIPRAQELYAVGGCKSQMDCVIGLFEGNDMMLKIQLGQTLYLWGWDKYGELGQELAALGRCRTISTKSLIKDSLRNEHGEPRMIAPPPCACNLLTCTCHKVA
ncbi:MAG: hypothetical protein BWY09_02908 [Candidatus Hydrogenedentes bacterium ADurb.Bin179]|nr:MAG: hypothetical protein BWY09_02908 [Candidatus Hydrogenedentes bacterium ADurb.Bin179]